jgi:hypothetical protein
MRYAVATRLLTRRLLVEVALDLCSIHDVDATDDAGQSEDSEDTAKSQKPN